VRLPDSARAAARAVREALNASVLEEAHSVYKPGLAGLSAYLPATAVPARYVTTRFAIDTLWDEFLVAMLSGVPTSGALPSLLLSEPADGDPVARLFEATATASSAAPGVVRLQYKSAWDNWSTVSSGTSPLPASVLLDAGIASGPTVVSFRALDAQGRPSAVAERQVTVVDLPVTLSPVLTEFPLAINRTRAIVIDATPRDPFFSFTVAWQGLPSQVNGAGSTTDVNFGSAPAPAFPITLQLAASPAASEGRYPIRLVVAAGSAPSVKTVLGFDLVLSLSLPDIAVAPLSLSDDLPLPGDPVFVWTNVTNLGFENVSDTRIQVTVTNASGTAELANYTVGPLTPGAGVPVTANFTAALGLQEVRVRALPEPAVVELNSSNNEHSRAVMLDRFSVALEPPALPVRGALGGNSTPVAVRMVNTGTDADNYTLAVSGLSNGSWTAVLATNAVYLAGRASQTLMIDVTPPAGAEGGDTLTFDLTANSLADTSVSASAALRVSIEETFSATVSALPNDIEVPYVGSTQVGLLLTNTGNGHESFLLLLQSGDPKLSARLDNFTAVLAPGASSAFVLLVADEGLFSTDRPYAVEVIALSQGSGARFSALVSVRVEPHAALTVEPLDPSPSVGAGLNATFHVLVRNAGNTNAVTSITAASTMPELAARVGASGALLSPGGFLIVNVTAQFASAPLAGTFPVTVLATDTRTGASGNATVEVVVPALRDYSAGVTAASGEGSRVLERTITIENRGNVPEAFSVVVGYVAVGLQVALTPSNGTILVPARGNATLVVRVEWPAPSQAAGQIPIVFTPRGGGSPLTVTVPYAFEQPPTDSALGWAAVALASIAGIGAYFLATRKRGPDPPPS
jgi:hypothetical protein